MNSFRFHFERSIAGTTSTERRQVRLQLNPDGSNTILVNEWRKSGGSLSHREYLQTGSAIMDLRNTMIGVAAADGWTCSFDQELVPQSLRSRDLLTIIEPGIDLMPDLEQIAAATTEVDFPLEQQGAIYMGAEVVQLTRSKRKRGEQRELRYDTIRQRTQDGTLASRLLCLLVMKHGGKFMYEDDDPLDGIDLANYASDLADYERLVPLIESWGIKLRRFTGAALRTPGGIALRPAVF